MSNQDQREAGRPHGVCRPGTTLPPRAVLFSEPPAGFSRPVRNLSPAARLALLPCTLLLAVGGYLGIVLWCASMEWWHKRKSMNFGNSFLGICLGVAVLLVALRGCPRHASRAPVATLTR